MSRQRDQIYADLPPSLRSADETLHRYGRWAADRLVRRRCGSAEGMYRAPPNDDDREPRAVLMSTPDAMAAQRALSRVPEIERVVLAALYVPNRLPAHVLIARMHIPPRLSRERHLRGVRMFDNILRLCCI